MKKYLVLIVLAAVLVGGYGCSIFRTPTPTSSPAPTGTASATATPSRTATATATATFTPLPASFFGPIAFASGVTAAGGVINPATTFPPGTTQIYAVWSYQNMRQGAPYSAVWYWNGALWRQESFVWDIAQSGTQGTAKYIVLSDPNGLISGEYRLELYIGAELVQVATLTVLPYPTATPRPTFTPAPTSTPTLTPPPTLSPEDLVRAARSALVRIWVQDNSGNIVTVASGALVDSRGLILTNWHILTDENGNLHNAAGEVFVGTYRSPEIQAEKEYVAQVLSFSQTLDLAVLRVVRDVFGRPGPFFFFPAVFLGDSARVEALDSVFILGYPAATQSFPIIIEGIVSGRVFDQSGDWLTVDKQINPGVSGGMALDEMGRLIGVPNERTFGTPSGQVGYVRPINLAKPLIDEARRRVNEPIPQPLPFNLGPGDHAAITAPDGLSLRSGPGLTYPTVGQAPLGARVTILLGPSWVDAIPWYNVIVDVTGFTGWCSGYYLRPVEAEAPPADHFIAFASNRTGNYDIFIVRPDGTGLQNLTSHPAKDTEPSWSPDRRFIAFSSDRGGDFDIYLLDLGSGLTPPKVLDAIRGPGDQVHPAFAKDGQRLAYASNEDGDWEIFVNSLDGLNKRQLTFNTAWDSFPAWGPDGGHLIFTSDRNGNYDLYSIDVASGIEQRLTANVASDAFPACSPDESRIAFASARSGLLEIYVANASQIEASLVRLTDSTNAPQPNRYPDWSPDGGWIVFASWRDGQAELYVMKADGSNLTRLTNSPGDDELPAWSQ